MTRNTRIQLWALAITFVILMLLTMFTWAFDGWLLVPAGAIGALFLYIVTHPPAVIRPPLVLMVDRSGSLYGDLNNKAIALAESFISWARYARIEVHVVQFDHRVIGTTIMPYGAGSVTWSQLLGGTNFEPPLAYARSIPNAHKVMITDGYGDPRLDFKDVDVLWLPVEDIPVGFSGLTTRSITRASDQPDQDVLKVVWGWSR